MTEGGGRGCASLTPFTDPLPPPRVTETTRIKFHSLDQKDFVSMLGHLVSQNVQALTFFVSDQSKCRYFAGFEHTCCHETKTPTLFLEA